MLSGYPPYELSRLDDSVNYPNTAVEFQNMELDNLVFEKVGDDFEENKMGTGTVPFHDHVPNALSEFVGGISSITFASYFFLIAIVD